MKKAIIIIVAVVAVIAIAVVGSYNGLVSSQETISQYQADIQTNLQRRADLVPNLVETVKGYAKHEEEVYTEIADARAAMMGAGNMTEAANADAAMTSALSRLLAVAESYPELKANQNFLDLQTQLEGTENRISVARTKYNSAVKDFNERIRKFPTVIIANIFGFDKADYFEAAPGAETVPSVNFGS